MTTWFTSDLHIGHANIARFCDRPFPHGPEGVEEMNRAIVELWNAQVAPEDIVWLLGDAVMGKIRESLEWIALLNGTIHLVLGNHDRPWERGPDSVNKARKWVEPYMEAGFASLQHEGAIIIGSRGVRMHHFPYDGDSTAEDRFADARPRDRGAWLLHGHVHEKWRQRGRMINVGLDAWGGRLISLEQVANLIEAGPRDLDRLEWRAAA